MESTPWRTPLGELPVDVDRSAELDAICSEVLDGPFDGTQLCTPPGLTPIPTTPPLSQWARNTTPAQRARYSANRRVARAADSYGQRERRRGDWARDSSQPAVLEARRRASEAWRARRHEEAARDPGTAELHEEAEKLLDYQHRCSGAPITANSMRVAALERGADEYEEAVEATSDDIAKYAHVSLGDAIECVRAFQEREAAFGDMHVCATCGVRDPRRGYTCHDLHDVPDGHWWWSTRGGGWGAHWAGGRARSTGGARSSGRRSIAPRTARARARRGQCGAWGGASA